MTISDIINGIIAVEGGYTNNPNDAGGPTNLGITLAELQSLHPGATIDDLKNLTKAQAYDIYEKKYYTEPHIDLLYPISPAIAAEVMDTGVNMGTDTAVKFLQSGLNALNLQGTLFPDLVVDGGLGQHTADALAKFLHNRGSDGEAVILKVLNCLQGAKYISLSQARQANESFVYGWFKNRINI